MSAARTVSGVFSFMQFQTGPQALRSLINRRMQVSFVVGLILGVLLGWAFSGVISAIMRFGLLAVLLVPFVLALIFWWKVRQSPKSDSTTIVTWSNAGLPPLNDDPFGNINPPRRKLDEDFIDLDELRREREL